MGDEERKRVGISILSVTVMALLFSLGMSTLVTLAISMAVFLGLHLVAGVKINWWS